ncbi:hypothetical protein [Streptosporangium canum]|uniref:hypothetical protein n=1 Tax=Streptosporangium canum TaxID=324952 RepID=UPI0037A533FB
MGGSSAARRRTGCRAAVQAQSPLRPAPADLLHRHDLTERGRDRGEDGWQVGRLALDLHRRHLERHLHLRLVG